MPGSSRLAIVALVASLVGFASAASAQSAPAAPENQWRHGTTLGLFAGSATDTSATRGTVGGGLGWEINQRIELEGSGAWLAARHGDSAFAAELKIVANLTRPAAVVPFLGAGIGMYRASFDTTSGAMPTFYQRPADSSAGTSRTFTDPSFVFTGGIDIFASGHFSVRPEVSVRLVTHASSVHPVTMAGLRATYHFELHEGWK
jgi:outer membrane protein with beta-barrel domain